METIMLMKVLCQVSPRLNKAQHVSNLENQKKYLLYYIYK